jgi:hypothetical protein
VLADPNAPLRNLLAAAVPHPPSPPLRVGSAVRWHSTRTCGLGQIAALHADGTATVRTWLPARTVTVTVPTARLCPLPHLTTLIESEAP